MDEKHPSPQNYAQLLESIKERIKERIKTAQVQAALAVNSELVMLYWGIGKEILTRQYRRDSSSRYTVELERGRDGRP